MKKVDSILAHLRDQPLYAKLRKQSCFSTLAKALPASLQRGVLFMYVKNRILFIAVKHPAFKMEFDYKLSSIKSLLRSLPPLVEACRDHEIADIRVFVSKYAPDPEPKRPTEPRYKEHAHPDFPLKAQTPEIRDLFEQIRQAIARNCR